MKPRSCGTSSRRPIIARWAKGVRDALDPEQNVVLFPGHNTDGTYLWPCELAYYVAKYHVRLPEAFVEHMASKNWMPPDPSEIDFEALYRGLPEDG